MYFTLYFVVCIVSVIIGYQIFILQGKSLSGRFFFSFTIFLSSWFLNYFLFFSHAFLSYNALLYSSRVNFSIGILAAYSLLFFVKYYNQDKPDTYFLRRIGIPSVFLFLGITVFSGSIIDSLRFDSQSMVYREIYGHLYFIIVGLYGIFGISFVREAYRKIHSLKGFDKIRLKKIVQSVYLLFLALMIFQVILPFFDIWIFEKELIIFYLIFVVWTYLLLGRYYFRGSSSILGQALNSSISLGISIFVTNLVQNVYLSPLAQADKLNFWVMEDSYNSIMIVSGIVFYCLSYTILRRTLIKRFFHVHDEALVLLVGKFQKSLAKLMTFDSLQRYVQSEIYQTLGASYSAIIVYSDDSNEYQAIQDFFTADAGHTIFINDNAFFDEYSHDNAKDIMKILPFQTSMVFPIYDDGGIHTGIFLIGQKQYGEFYTIEEIEAVGQITLFLEAHIKYLRTYQKIEELTRTLDKKVDEKTIQYNDLINKQKEFISIISHEIKSPISGAILQADSIMDDIENTMISRDDIKEELALMNMQLIKVGDLLTKLFSVQYYDTHAVTLFREKIHIQNMINMELDIYESMHQEVQFIRDIDPTMKFIEIDKIQFQQVLTNLLNNAIKFSESGSPIIRVSSCIYEGNFMLTIEDNGKGFHDIRMSDVFDKYAVGTGGSVGLGIGLYLCKRIVEMHGGTISAAIGEILGGAKVSITIPI